MSSSPAKSSARPSKSDSYSDVAVAPVSGSQTASLRVWMDGKLVDKADAKVSVWDHGLLYGDGVFEGIRAYNGRVFKLGSHIRRLFGCAEKIRLKPAYSMDQIAAAIRETLAANNLKDAYIRLIITRGVGTLGLHPFRCPNPGTIIIADKIQIYPPELYESGMKVIVAKRPRIPIECLDPAIKSLNYLNNILAKIEAIDADVLEAIMLNTRGEVSECTGDNIFVIKSGEIFTPPTSSGILHGVTRSFVMNEIAPALGYKVREKAMSLLELLESDEVFLTGTAAEIIGVSQVDEHRIGSGALGPVTRTLAAEFRKRVASGAPED